MGVRTRGWGKTSFMGQEFDWTVEYTEFEPPTRMESRDVEGRRDLRVVYTLEPVEGGTMVTQQMEVTTGLGMLGVLRAPVLKAMLSRALRTLGKPRDGVRGSPGAGCTT